MIDNTRENNLSLEMYYTVNTEICTLISPRLHVRNFSVVINSSVRSRYYRKPNLVDNIYIVRKLATIINTDNR